MESFLWVYSQSPPSRSGLGMNEARHVQRWMGSDIGWGWVYCFIQQPFYPLNHLSSARSSMMGIYLSQVSSSSLLPRYSTCSPAAQTEDLPMWNSQWHFLNCIYMYECVCVCVYVLVCTCHVRVQLIEAGSLSLYHVGPKNGSRLNSRHLYPLHHLISPLVTFINEYLSSNHIYLFIIPSHQPTAIQGNKHTLNRAQRRQISLRAGKVTLLINTRAASKMQTGLAV